MNYYRTKATKHLLELQGALHAAQHAGVDIGHAKLLVAAINDILDRGGRIKPERLKLLADLGKENNKDDK